MKFIVFVLFLHCSIGWAIVCTYGDDWRVIAGFSMKNHLILITSEDVVLHAKDFKIKDGRLTYSSLKETDLLSNWVQRIRYIFPYEDYLISLNLETVSDITRFVGYKLYLNNDLSRVDNYTQFKVNMYTYVPGEDPLNLMSLLAKYPEDDLDIHMKAIVSFPFNRRNFPNRFFVYYLESETGKRDLFKRHIMVKNTSHFGSTSEVNWHHDEKSGSCFTEDQVYDSVIRLGDNYEPGTLWLFFDIIEFVGTQFALKRVEADRESVKKNLTLLKTGSLMELFGCVTKPPPTEPQKPEEREPREEDRPKWLHVIIILMVIFFSIAILMVLYFIVLAVIRIRKIRQLKAKQKGKKKGSKSDKSSSAMSTTSKGKSKKTRTQTNLPPRMRTTTTSSTDDHPTPGVNPTANTVP